MGTPTLGNELKPKVTRVDNGRLHALLWILVVVEIVVGVILGVRSTGSPQCCDTAGYANEALQIVAGNGSWLADSVHNYLYPALLALLHLLGMWNSPDPTSGDGRLAVGVVQIALLYLASFFLIVVLSRCLRMRFVATAIVVCAVAILPAAAWSGYWLSEGLAAPVILVVIALWVLTCYWVLLRPGARSATAAIFGLGLASGFAWMTRPGLIWVPLVAGFLAMTVIIASTLISRARRHIPDGSLLSYQRAVALVAALFLGVALALVPQLAFDQNIGHLLKLDLAAIQAQRASTIWRYITNLSGCGPAALGFSALSKDIAPLDSGQIVAPDSVLWRLTTYAAHLVSGWDPLPSPTYATSLATGPWILVTLASGFVCAAPVLAGSWLVGTMRQLWAGWRMRTEGVADVAQFAIAASAAGVLVFFGVAELALLNTSTEMRFNVMGWLSADVCIVFLIASGWLSRKRLVLYAGISVTLSAFILILGQMTLSYSAYWLQCSR